MAKTITLGLPVNCRVPGADRVELVGDLGRRQAREYLRVVLRPARITH